jgi:hypothetical protein
MYMFIRIAFQVYLPFSLLPSLTAGHNQAIEFGSSIVEAVRFNKATKERIECCLTLMYAGPKILEITGSNRRRLVAPTCLIVGHARSNRAVVRTLLVAVRRPTHFTIGCHRPSLA